MITVKCRILKYLPGVDLECLFCFHFPNVYFIYKFDVDGIQSLSRL